MAFNYDTTPGVYHEHRLYQLTTLQIGDLQSYVSRLFLQVDHGEKQLVFFVDNRPWTAEKHRPKLVELWQLMVTQSRTSPFTNKSLRSVGRENCGIGKESAAGKGTSRRKLFQKDQRHLVKSFQNLLNHRLKSVVSVQELSDLLHGCVTFELDWEDVRGINYTNELQTDTCVALETKYMLKRYFRSFDEALLFYGVESESSGCEWNSAEERKRKNMLHSKNSKRSSSSSLDENITKRCSPHNKVNESCNDICLNCDSFDWSPCYSDHSTGTIDFNHSEKRQSQGDDQFSLLDETESYQKGKSVANSGPLIPVSSMDLEETDCQFFDCQCCFHSDRAASSDMDSCIDNATMHIDFLTEGNLVMDGSTSSATSSHINNVTMRVDSFIEGRLDGSASLDTSPRTMSMESLTEKGLAMEDRSLDFQSLDDSTPSRSCQIVSGDAMSHYRDTLLLFRFCDPILPLELKDIITADQRLLKMLESGLPSWVIFLQSYPLLCKVYRPWMRPLAKTMYVLVSIVTVIIGFYDLYKNVPVLKAAAARICGPLFEWIEAWEMVSRIKYLGTMLFLQNCEKTFRWLLMIFRTSRRLSVMLMKPMIEPLEELGEILYPIWNLCSDGILWFATVVWMVGSLLFQFINSFLQLVIWPFIALLTAIWKLANWLLYPIISLIWGLIVLPVRLIITIVNLMVALVCSLFKVIQNLWVLVNSGTQLISVTGPPVSSSVKAAKSSASQWRILWNDIFSQVFRAIRSILNGLVAFFTTCNRHRLSIYNHTMDFLLRLALLVKSAHLRLSGAYHRVLDAPLLNEGGFEDEGICNCCTERRSKNSSVGLSLRQKHTKHTLADTCSNCQIAALKKAKVE